MPPFWHITTPERLFSHEKEPQKNPQIFLGLRFLLYTLTISGVISASVCAPHICMVSASSPASFSM